MKNLKQKAKFVVNGKAKACGFYWSMIFPSLVISLEGKLENQSFKAWP